MVKQLIWVHDKALNKHHPVLQTQSADDHAIFIWDDHYFRRRSYTLKRLVFIYETLCQMPVDIIKGDTLDVINTLAPARIQTFFSADSQIKALTQQLSQQYQLDIISAAPFVQLPETGPLKRFFKYWHKAKKTAFLTDGHPNP